MTIIEPFTFQKVTAFKERMELGNKLNEVIDFINQGVVNISNITGSVAGHVITFTFYMTDGDTHTFSFDLNDFITSAELTTVLSSYVTSSALTTILSSYVTSSSLASTLSSYVTSSSLATTLTSYALDNSVVKLNGNQTINDVKTYTSSPRVPDTPDNDVSAVNKKWVNDKRKVISVNSFASLMSYIPSLNLGDSIIVTFVSDTTKNFSLGNDVVEFTSMASDNVTRVFGDIGVCTVSGSTRLHGGLRINPNTNEILVNTYDSSFNLSQVVLEASDTYPYFIATVIIYS